MMCAIKVGDLYVHYISMDDEGKIIEVLLKPRIAKKFEMELAGLIAEKVNGVVIKR